METESKIINVKKVGENFIETDGNPPVGITDVTDSVDNLKLNMNENDELQRKRTSLVLIPHQSTDELTLSINDNDQQLFKTCSVSDNSQIKTPNNRNSIISVDSSDSSKSSITTPSSSDNDALQYFCNLENENTTSDGELSVDKIHLSNSSSPRDDYSLHEKLQNFVNESLAQQTELSGSCFNPKKSCDSLLSPQEVPMGRRYAEIAQFKNSKRSSDTTTTSITTNTPSIANGNVQQIKGASRRLAFSGLDSSANGNVSNDGVTDDFQLNDSPVNLPHHICHDDNANEQFSSLDVNDSYCNNGHFEDETQALLPNCQKLSRDELNRSFQSLGSSSDGGRLAEDEISSNGSDTPPCGLGLVERLLRTHPVWFLPGIQRAGAVHLLQGKEEGNFIVRGSSQPNTMAVSVRLPPDTGPYIEHYLIQSNEGILNLESSHFKFDSIPALIAHYAQCCDELPAQLILPRALRDAKNRQQLSSLALLGQEFWRYPLANPKLNNNPKITSSFEAKSPNSLTDTSGIGVTIFSSTISNPNNVSGKLFSPTNPLSQVGTPSDTNSSLSSFTSSPAAIMSPQSMDSVVMTMSPMDPTNNRTGMGASNNGLSMPSSNMLSTFKSISQVHSVRPFTEKPVNIESIARPQRPTPPNTLNLGSLRVPPAPPIRWSKPLTPISSVPQHSSSEQNNFTVTTTVTFSLDNNNHTNFVEIKSPIVPVPPSTNFQTFSKRLSPEGGECKRSDTLSSQSSSQQWQYQSSKDSNQSQTIISDSEKARKNKARKQSKHYQESFILDSPQVYCRSALGDKISDYEDLWSQKDPLDRGGAMTSFRPDDVHTKRPDILAETPTVVSLNCNLLSPTNSVISASPLTSKKSVTDYKNPDQMSTNNLSLSTINQSNLLNSISPEALLSPIIDAPSIPTEVESAEISTPTNEIVTKCRSKQSSPFYAEPADALKDELAAIGGNSSILRRSQRNFLLPSNHRHSEPPKGEIVRTALCPAFLPKDVEKVAGSLDELKNTPIPQSERVLGKRRDAWPLDSSWEFMSNNEICKDIDYADYDLEEQWTKVGCTKNTLNGQFAEIENNGKENKQKPVTIHQIIANRMPDLNLPELIRCSTPQCVITSNMKKTSIHGLQQNLLSHQYDKNRSNGNRISAYDNVEKSCSYTTSFVGTDSTQSDDGTVFSEPWDSSQWDSLMPQDDTTSDTIHLSKCRATLCNSEDDTIMEDHETEANKLKNHSQKVATILRSRSIRDREILCHPRNKANQIGGPGDSVKAYTLRLAEDQTSTFSRNIENFISCTKESREAAPQVVMRNMRQFMNGMKNYLVKHGEADFHQEVQKARSQLKADEFLNLDHILETVMHQLVVLPLREHLYGLFVDYYTRSGDIQLLVENVKYACARNPVDFGIRSTIAPPTYTALNQISNLLLRLQEAEAPLEKLDLFLCVISVVFEATGCQRGQQLGADDFLPILVYVVAKCGFIGAEIEAEFMWGLLQPALLSGEASYYLTSLCSAVHVLKSFMASDNEGTGSLDWRSSSLPACSSVLRVIIPDEYNGSLQTRTLPVRPHTTTKDVCRIIAHKARITNPQDYGLFKLVDGEETILAETECPQDARIAARGKHCMLAYKRIDAKIAWPTAPQPPYT